MTDRKPIIAGNWKLNQTHTEAISLVQTFSYELNEQDYDRVEIVVCPPFTAIRSVQLVIEGENLPIGLGAQNLYWEDDGAYTGEVSGAFLKALNCTYVIVGHSERRKFFGETDETVNKRTQAAFRNELTPIVCVGETDEEREAGRTEEVVGRQITEGLAGFTPEQVRSLVVAYEPVWAIGTGKAATPEDANATIAFVRKTLGSLAGDDVAEAVRIQYGGSVSPGNIAQLMAQPDIDGALVGGASLDPKSFAMIVKY
ncbi:MAG TPA: triose-phosphate isomerase [Actinomycetota bacterium]|nr:triose-phosphate isomerase [Actinomycetota bacterium]